MRQFIIMTTFLLCAGVASVDARAQDRTSADLKGSWSVSGAHLKMPCVIEFKDNGLVVKSSGSGSSSIQLGGEPWTFDGKAIKFEGWTKVDEITVTGTWRTDWKSKDEIEVVDSDNNKLKLKRLNDLKGSWSVSGAHLKKPYVIEFKDHAWVITSGSGSRAEQLKDKKIDLEGIFDDKRRWTFDGKAIKFKGWTKVDEIIVTGTWRTDWKSKDEIEVVDSDNNKLKLKRLKP